MSYSLGILMTPAVGHRLLPIEQFGPLGLVVRKLAFANLEFRSSALKRGSCLSHGRFHSGDLRLESPDCTIKSFGFGEKVRNARRLVHEAADYSRGVAIEIVAYNTRRSQKRTPLSVDRGYTVIDICQIRCCTRSSNLMLTQTLLLPLPLLRMIGGRG